MHRCVPDDFQRAQYIEDKIDDAVLALEANTEIMIALADFYESLNNYADFDLGLNCGRDMARFSVQIKYMISRMRMQMARAKLLATTMAARKSLVSSAALPSLRTNSNVQ